MQIVTNYPDGLFNWVDLATTDIEGAKAFYTALFGWETTDMPLPGDGFYTTFKLNGYQVAGGGQMQPEMQAQGIPSNWSSYVKHSNADAIAEKITAAGGTLMFPPMDIMSEGRMLMAVDPSGAVFGVWQPQNHIGAQLVNISSSLVWNELQTRDAAAAQAFYSAVFGWTAEADDSGYVTYAMDGRRQAGMMQMDENWPAGVPSNWAVYFGVDDIHATVAKAQALGGQVMVPPTPAGAVGVFAVIQDPQGAVFTAIQMNMPGDPPPGA